MKVEMVTPQLAEKYLEKNIENRRVREWWVNSLAGAIRRDEWILTHQGIAFDTNNRLIDGQHKLRGVIAADKAVPIAVYRGVDSEAFKVLDIGVKRSYSDITGLSKKTSEVCRHIARIIWPISVNSADQLLKVAESGVEEMHEDLLAHCSTNAAILSSAPIRSIATIMILDGHSKDHILNIYSNMITQKYSLLPPIAETFVRQVNRGSINASNKPDTAARALKVFDKRNKDLTKLVIGTTDADAVSIYIKKVMKSLRVF